MPANRDHHGAKLARHDPIASSSRASDPIASTSSLPPTQTSPGSSTSDVKVPRPPNAFFLFRKHFCNERKAQNIYSTDGTHISKLAGEAWSALSDMERAPWFEKQEVVREKHMKKYPNYTFAPIHDPTKRKARKAMKPSRVGSQSGVAGGSKDLDEPSSSSTSQVNGHLTSSVPRRSPIRTTPLPATGELEFATASSSSNTDESSPSLAQPPDAVGHSASVYQPLLMGYSQAFRDPQISGFSLPRSDFFWPSAEELSPLPFASESELDLSPSLFEFTQLPPYQDSLAHSLESGYTPELKLGSLFDLASSSSSSTKVPELGDPGCGSLLFNEDVWGGIHSSYATEPFVY